MKIRKMHVIKAVIAALCVLAVVLITIVDNRNRNIDDTYEMYARIDNTRINIQKVDGEYYLFLPGYADEQGITYSAAAREHDVHIMKSANISSVFINTNSGSLDKILADKSYKETGDIEVVDENGYACFDGGLEYIKGRGNYSWNNWDKKPFKIKLNKNGSFLGLGEGKDYALIANASDATLIRNEVARGLEVAVGIPFATTGRFVDLYINSNYMGNYYLCASIEVGEDRVDISSIDDQQQAAFSRLNSSAFDVYETPQLKGWNLPEVATDITGGYLLEREFGDRYNLEYGDMNNGFVTDGGEHFIVMSPKYCTVSEINYIADFLQKAEDEIFSTKPLGEYVDPESFAKRYLVEEVVKNYDGGVSSAFYFKDSDSADGLLKAGPGWDFDMSLGNYLDWMEYSDQDPTGITGLYLSEHSSTYFKELIEHDDIKELVSEYYESSALGYMNEMAESGIDKYQEMLDASARMDAVRWKDMYDEKGYTTADDKEYQQLKDFILVRTEYLTKEWLK